MRLHEFTNEASTIGTSPTTGSAAGQNPATQNLKAGQQLKVDKQDAKSTTLVDKNTGVKTVVPNDPKKPGMIQTDTTGKAFLNTKPQGPVQQVKPGQTVTVK